VGADYSEILAEHQQFCSQERPALLRNVFHTMGIPEMVSNRLVEMVQDLDMELLSRFQNSKGYQSSQGSTQYSHHTQEDEEQSQGEGGMISMHAPELPRHIPPPPMGIDYAVSNDENMSMDFNASESFNMSMDNGYGGMFSDTGSSGQGY
jgi:hypothetical protein